jgi:hypothetical protein
MPGLESPGYGAARQFFFAGLRVMMLAKVSITTTPATQAQINFALECTAPG